MGPAPEAVPGAPGPSNHAASITASAVGGAGAGAGASTIRLDSRSRTAPGSQRAPTLDSHKTYRASSRHPKEEAEAPEAEAPNTVIIRIHERSYSDQEVIINPVCITRLSAFSYESDLVEVTAVSDAGPSDKERDPNDGPSRAHPSLHPDGNPSNPNTGHSANTGRRLPKHFLFKAKPDLTPKDARWPDDSKQADSWQISVHDSIAAAFGLKALGKVTIRKVSSHTRTLDHIELTFRDQYVGRAEMWRLAMSLEDRCLYVGQKINFAGIVRATVTRLWINERRVHCGYVAASTKPIFRSESAKINLFIQLAREMWEFDEDGELYFEKCLTGFMPALLRRWRTADTNHVISVILFARVFYDPDEVDMLRRRQERDAHAVPIREDVKGRFYADYFKVVLDLESHPDWGAVMETLKEEFFRFQHDILLLRRARQSKPHPDPLGPEKSDILRQTPLYQSGYQDSSALQLLLREQVALAGSLSYSYEGCILEAINLTLNPFDQHFIDRDLTRTGLSLIFVTAGTGHFEVDKTMLRITTERMIECGIGLDLVCLTKMPLHSVPLFKFSSEVPELVNYYYPDRSDQAGTFGREPRQQHQHQQQHGHRPPIPPTFAHPQQWAPKQASAQAPDPLYFDPSRSSAALQSPQISSAASTLGRASTAAMTASTTSFTRASTASTLNPYPNPNLHLNPQPPKTIEYYSMPHWIDCSFYNLQMDKPFRADRFVPRCKMFEVQMMGIMENELADISIPYLDERAPVVLGAASLPGTPAVGLPQLTRAGTGAGGGGGGGAGTGGAGGAAGVMSPYGLGPGSGSFGISGAAFSSAQTVRPSKLSSATTTSVGGASSSTATVTAPTSYFDQHASGDDTDRRERAGRQMARDQFDEELFKPVEPAHVVALRNAQGQVGLYGTGEGGRPGGQAQGQGHGQGPPGSAAFRLSSSPARPQSPRTLSSEATTSIQPRGGGDNDDQGGPSSISPEKNPTAAMMDRVRERSAGSKEDRSRDRSRSAQRGSAQRQLQRTPSPSSSPLHLRTYNPPGRGSSRPAVSSRLQNDYTEPDSSVDTVSQPLRILLTRSVSQISQSESVQSSSTGPTIGRARGGQLPGTLEWIGRAMAAQPATDSTALMLYHSGVLEVDTGEAALSAAPSPASTTRTLPSISAVSSSSLASSDASPLIRTPLSPVMRGRTPGLAVHAATISAGSRVGSPAGSSTPPERPHSMVSERTPQPKSMGDLLRRGLSWWGNQPVQPKLESPSADAYQTLQRLSAKRPGSAGGSGTGTAGSGSVALKSKRPPARGPLPFTSPEVPKASNPRHITFDVHKPARKNVSTTPGTSPTSIPIAIGPQSPVSRASFEHLGGQSQREVARRNAQEEEFVRQRSLESQREIMQIAAQRRIEKQTLVNPSNPHKNRATFSSQLGRWQHLFPTRTNRHTVKWLSMTSPACLPLTTLYLPLEADLAAHWKESPYTITASTDAMSILTKRNATTAPAVAIVREMASQRLAQGFQFIVPSVGWNNDGHLASLRSQLHFPGLRHAVLRHHPSDLFQPAILTSGSPIFLSLPNEIHQISCDQGLVQVKRYLRNTEYDTSPIEYSCYIWARNLPSYQTVHASFKYPDSASYDWNYLDSIISGAEEPRFTESLKYWRTRFVLVPSEGSPKEMLAPNGSRLYDEEVRLMGMDKLADLFMKARFRSPQAAPAERGGRSRGLDLRFIPTSLDPAASVHDENFMRALEQFVQERAKERERDAVPAKAKRLADLSLEEIVKDMWKEDGLKIHDRLWHRYWYSDAFTGAEFVTWLCRKFDDVRSREDAVEWGTKLQELGLFEHAGSARGFIDGHSFYSVGAQWAIMQPRGWYNKVRPHRESNAAENNPSTPKRRRVQMSHTLYVDLAAGRKSDRYETAILHHDIAHNPANGFNFQVHWLGTTARFVEDTVRNWTATVERYGLRLIEAPVGQIKDIAKHNPFQAPMPIKLAVSPPPTSSYAHLLPVHVLPEQYFEYALLRDHGFILDQEASDRYPDDIEIVYDSRPPKFDYSQFVHQSGIAFVQVLGGEEGFLWLNNRLFTSHLPANSRAGQGQRAASRGGSDIHAHAQQSTPTAHVVTAQAQADAELLRNDLASFCADKEELLAFYAEVKGKLQEKADHVVKQQQQPDVVMATPMGDESETAGIGRRWRRKTGDILWAK
ncbi:unnamed protein product [Tilletia laevis]|uniref:Vacuolar membrane-associated protein IML1 n=3 Tax=Tilletia TaxID=13289 RepID=A0A8T8TT22_9BASI|nr:hypothetical protein CF336_g824 [Tilletia laevis]KAE8265042.1 hypothetical protein A4X03_0g515 [Tilletia caries]KAE8203424.1 hypothetical protein CF335_g3024 [Tilletia laevis]CAD6888971.1 unnamed protein product [Tilletia caries]CAD6932144.1 unnamed protein product [Tilletia laevis]